MTTAIYARYSAGPRQTEQSIEGQVRVCRDYAKQKGLTVTEIYADRHITGRTDNRPEFQRLIADAKQKKFEAVLVYKTDRFARDKYDAVIYKKELKKHGVQIFYAAEPIPDGPEGIILEGLLESMAEYYSAELAQKIKRGMYENASKGRSNGGGRILGYRTGPDGQIQVDEREAEAVRLIFSLFVKGKRQSEIVELLNAKGYRTARGNLFGKGSLHSILSQAAYTGQYSWNGTVIEGVRPQIIEETLFRQAQEEKVRRTKIRQPKRPAAEYLLAGKVFCGPCKSPLHGVSGTGKSGKRFCYYVCAKARGKNKTCALPAIGKDALETAVLDTTLYILKDEELLRGLAEKITNLLASRDGRAEKKKDLEKELKKVQAAQKNIVKALETAPGVSILAERLNSLEAEKRELEKDLARIKAPVLTKEQIFTSLGQFGQALPGETEEERRKRIVQTFVSKVWVWPDKITVDYNITGPRGVRQQTAVLHQNTRLSNTLAGFTVYPGGFSVTLPR